MRTESMRGRSTLSAFTAILFAAGLTACGGGGGGAANNMGLAPEPQETAAPIERTTVTLGLDEALLEIQALPLEETADLLTARLLREGLAAELTAAGMERFTSEAPSVEDSYVEDFRLSASADGSVTFNWSYSNRGDYDQNSLVTIADLSVIGNFWQRTSNDPDWARAMVADGDDNGEINASDIVPIASNFLGTVDGYIISGSMDPEDPESWEEIATIPFDAGGPGTSNSIPLFSFVLPDAMDGMSFALNPIGVGSPGESSPLLLFSDTESQVPPAPTASQGSFEDHIAVSWEASEGALNYWLERSEAEDGEFDVIYTTSGEQLAFSDFNVTAGNHYWYRTRHITEAGYVSPSPAGEGWTLETPAAPQNVQASDGSSEDSVAVTWDLVDTAEAYQVSRSDSEDGDYQAIGTTGQNLYSDATGDYGIAYFYRVQATSPAGVSAPSDADSGHRGVLGTPPTVNSVSPLNGLEGSLAKFNATFSGNAPESYLWNFNGAANTSTQSSPTVLLGAPGTYQCTLTVANQWGGDSFDFTLNVNPQNSAISGVNPESGVEGTEVTFIADYSGAAATGYAWNFGGGAVPDTSIEQSPTVSLTTPGEYSASVAVTSEDGTETYFFTLAVVEGVPNISEVTPLTGDAGEMLTMIATNIGGSIDSWDWDFGSAATPSSSSDESPMITLGSSGSYPCTVTATNSKGSHEFEFTLTVLPPPPHITGVSPDIGVSGSALSPAATNTGGTVSSWAWYFGGGATPNSSALVNPTITLGAVGVYNCSVVATNVNGSVIYPFTLTVNAPPPDITGVAPKSGVSGASIQPVATNSGGPIESWSWDFGGGASPNTSNDASPIINLGAPGTYPSTVTVQTGSEIDQFSFDLVVSIAPPQIQNVTPDSGTSGASVEFTPTNNGGSVASWQWSFGGGASPNSSNEESPEVTLGSEGTYTVTLVATNSGGTDTFNFSLDVLLAPPDITGVSSTGGVTGTQYSPTATNSGGTADSWNWNFGGGATPNTSSSSTPSVTLGSPGAYEATVEATNVSGSGTFPFLLEVSPPAPGNLQATDGSHDNKVMVSWNASTGADRYVLERSTSENGSYTVLDSNINSTVYNDTSASIGTTYWYRVFAVVDPVGNSAIFSPASTKDSGWRSTVAPTGVSATDGDHASKVSISWNSVTGATSYTILRSTSENGSYSSIGTTSNTSFDDNNVTASTYYWYKVRSESSPGSGGTSSPDSGYAGDAPS